MKQDIRDLFKQKSLPKKKLPNFHEDDFLDKLTIFNQKKKSKVFLPILKIAASIVLILSVSYYFLNSDIEKNEQPEMFVEIQQIEKEYYTNIKIEWDKFVLLTDDQNLINKYQEKLKNLDLNYQEILIQYKTDKNNLILIEALIQNLKNRLQLLKDIQQHINLLNKEHENTAI
jgi:hypothetical protein